MRLKMIQTLLLTAFVLSGMVLVLNQPVESTDITPLHPTVDGPQVTMVPEGPVIHITLPGLHQERPNIEGFLMVVIMVSSIGGFVGSFLVSDARKWGVIVDR